MSVNVVSACEHMVQTSQPILAGVTLVVHGKHLSVLGCFGIGSLSGPSTHLDQVNQSYHILNCLVDQCLSTYLASTFISGHPTPGFPYKKLLQLTVLHPWFQYIIGFM